MTRIILGIFERHTTELGEFQLQAFLTSTRILTRETFEINILKSLETNGFKSFV